MKRRSRTPWRKSRTYGDLYGGRQRRRITDNIFARAHSLQRPGPDQCLPMLLEDNPSRDHRFPVSGVELVHAMRALPDSDRNGITHIWLRRRALSDGDRDAPLAEFICGSGVRLIVIYPWRSDGQLRLGRTKPTGKDIAQFLRFGAELRHDHRGWFVCFQDVDALKSFYVEHLFCHEVGHHVDWYRRRWSAANGRQLEEAADQYAVRWGALAMTTIRDGERAPANSV